MIYNAVQKLIDYALAKSLITADDVYVVRNQLMEALGLDNWEEVTETYQGESIDDLLETIQ